MAGQRIGYVRVSTLDQNEKRQLEGQVLDRVFTDKASGRDTARPQLTELLRSGVPKVVLAHDYGISRETVYQYLRQAKQAGSPPPAVSPAIL
ncbi:recombinase family protein [Pseudarthrobacter raffinosi]|uniref:recombinase family protein n=1 Tax=Pseudarthrobacter raffinosi TaxID=2953651 RepID=UPI00208F631E|nr:MULTISPECIES: recombinase family protein [unclassified Pseudarthrobacter]MCO4252702.1 recombinase family protein [Pseudarthrobacter sp. MDT3-9]MCO4264414.1 recombinase family protein [Pseudarthrobacter sp. MDT3-26]